jgi:hypothetical protein
MDMVIMIMMVMIVTAVVMVRRRLGRCRMVSVVSKAQVELQK